MPQPSYSKSLTGKIYYTLVNVNGSFGPSLFGTPTVFQETCTVSSVKTPGWRVMKPSQRSRVINNYSKSFFREIVPDSLLYQYATNGQPTGWSKNWYSGGITSAISPGTSVDSYRAPDPYPIAASALLKRLSSQKTSALVTIAEFHKTMGLVSSTAVRLASAIRSARRMDLHGMCRAIGLRPSNRQIKRFDRRKRQEKNRAKFGLGDLESFASKTWLEYSYGWKPLLRDIHSSAEALATTFTERNYVIRTEHVKQFVRSVKNGSQISGQFRFTSTIKEVRGAAIKVNYRISNGPTTVANTFGLLNPLEVAWELVPFSFVADWFIPIGSFLSNLSATNGLVFDSGVRSTRDVISIEQFWVGTGIPFSASGVTYTASGVGKRTREYVYINRMKLTEFPSAQLPQFRFPNSANQALSGIALLQSIFLKGR